MIPGGEVREYRGSGQGSVVNGDPGRGLDRLDEGGSYLGVDVLVQD